jgi:hypothetical protein
MVDFDTVSAMRRPVLALEKLKTRHVREHLRTRCFRSRDMPARRRGDQCDPVSRIVS